MEVDLELVTNLDKANKELKALKDNMVGIGDATVSVGKSMGTAFKSPSKDVEALTQTVKGLANNMKGFETLVNNISTSKSSAELVANFNKLVQAAEKTLSPIEAIEFKLKAIAGIRPFLQSAEDIEAADREAKQLSKDLDTIKSKDIGAPAESLRSRLKKAKEEVVQMADAYGALDARTLKAAKRAGELSDQMGDVNATIKALNPDAKLQAFTDLGQGIAGSFAIATGAMGLFGFASKDVQEGLLRIQSAIQLTQGINQILQLKDAWTNVRAVIRVFIADTIASNTLIQAQTVAEVENTVAKEANVIATGQVAVAEAGATVATAGLATAQGAAATSTGVLTTALALLTSPLGIILASVGALVIAYKLFGEETERLNDLTADQISKANELAQSQRNLRNAIDDTKDSIRVINGGLSELQSELLSRQRKFFAELDEIEESTNLSLKQAQEAAASGLISSQSEYQLEYTRIVDSGNLKRKNLNEKYNVDVELINAKAAKKDKEEADKSADERAKALKQNLDKLIQLRKDYQNALEGLAKSANTALGELFGGKERIEIERDASLKEIDALEQSIREKGEAEMRQARIVYGANSSKYKEILREYHEGIIKSEQAFDILRKNTRTKADEELLNLSITNELSRTEAILDAQTKLIEQFEINSKKRGLEMRKNGVKQTAIDALNAKELLDINSKFIDDDLSQQQAYYESIINARELNGEREIDFETNKQRELLNLQIQFDEARISELRERVRKETDINPNFDSTELQTSINELIEKVTNSRNHLRNLGDADEFSFANLFGLKLSKADEAEFNTQMQSLLQSAQSIYSQIIDIRRNEVAQQIALNDRLISSLDNRINSTETQIDREIRLNQLGFASNVEGLRNQLETEQGLRKRAAEDKARLVAQEARLARQQAAIGAVQQLASLTTAAAKLFEKGASTGTVGIIKSIATIATMVSAFLAFKQNIERATMQSFGDGGRIRGRSHADGGVIINAEGDEFMMRKRVAMRHMGAMEAINSEDWRSVPDSFLLPILKARGISLGQANTNEVFSNQTIINDNASNNGNRLHELERVHESMVDEIKGIKSHLIESERKVNMPDGSLMILKGNKTTIFKKR